MSADPRQVQIVGGTRRVFWINSLVEMGAIAAIMLLVCLVGIFSERRRRASTARGATTN